MKMKKYYALIIVFLLFSCVTKNEVKPIQTENEVKPIQPQAAAGPIQPQKAVGPIKTQNEVRPTQLFFKSQDYDQFIQGENYKIWYSKNFAGFREIKKGSKEWDHSQEIMKKKNVILDKLLFFRESGIVFLICKSNHLLTYDEVLTNSKISNSKILETDQRMVNNKLAFYFETLNGNSGNKIISSIYDFKTDSEMLSFGILIPEEKYEKYRLEIENLLNGIEVY
jgi:hypothetical protein